MNKNLQIFVSSFSPQKTSLIFTRYKIYNYVILLFILLSINSCQKSKSDLIVANVGDDNIYQSEFIERYEDYLLQTGIKDNIISRKEVLNSMVTELLLHNYDENEEIYSDPIYQKEVKWAEKQAILGFLKDREIYAKIDASDEEIRKAFMRANQKIAARHLYAPTQEEITNLYELLSIGVDFNTLAKQTFTDSTLKNNGGYLGYFSWGDMEPEFEDAAYSLKIGEISQPVKTKNGYSIIKLEDRVTHPLLTENEYQNKKAKFAQIIKIRKKKNAERDYANSVVDFSKVEFNNDAIKNIWKNFELKILKSGEIDLDEDIDNIAVKYDGKSYTVSEITKKLAEIPKYHLDKVNSEKRLKTAIKGLILQEKLLEIARDKDYDENGRVKDKLSKMKTNLFMNFKISQILKNSIINDSLVLDFYNSHPDFFSTHESVNVQEIIVDDLELAKQIKKELETGKDFAQLALTYSLRKQTANNGGNIGYIPITKFGNFQGQIKNVKNGEIVGPLEVGDIYAIFRIKDKKSSEKISFQDSKEVATLAVKFKHKNNIVKDYVEQLKSKVRIDINLANLGSAKIFQID